MVERRKAAYASASRFSGVNKEHWRVALDYAVKQPTRAMCRFEPAPVAQRLNFRRCAVTNAVLSDDNDHAEMSSTGREHLPQR